MVSIQATANKVHKTTSNTADVLSKKAKNYANKVPGPLKLPARVVAATGGSAAQGLAYLLGTGAHLAAGTSKLVTRIPGHIGHTVTYVISGEPTHTKRKSKSKNKPNPKPKTKTKPKPKTKPKTRK